MFDEVVIGTSLIAITYLLFILVIFEIPRTIKNAGKYYINRFRRSRTHNRKQ